MRSFSSPPGVDPDDPVWQRLSATCDELERRDPAPLSSLPLRERERLLIDVQLTLNRRAAAAGGRVWPVLYVFPHVPRLLVPVIRRARGGARPPWPRGRRPRRRR